MSNTGTLQETALMDRNLEATPPRRILRSIGAVLAGLVATFAVTTAVDMVMHALGIYPAFGERMADILFVPAAAYRLVFNVAGCYLTARLAPARPMQHALVLGAVGFALATVGALVMWGAGPAWYSLGIIATAIPCAWAGGALGRARASARA